MANTYDKGDLVRLTGTFTDPSAAPADPTVVVLRVKNPLTVVTLPGPTRDSAGVYHYDLSLDTVGTWYYRWEGTGAVQAAAESALIVRPTQF